MVEGMTPPPVTGVDRAQHQKIAQMRTAADGTVPQRVLIPLLMRLRWTLWWRELRSSTMKLIVTILMALYALGMMGTMVFGMGLTALASRDDALFIAIAQGVGGALVLGWLLSSLLITGVEDILSPARFAVLGRRARDLQPGMMAASFLGTGALLTVIGVLAVCVIIALWLLTGGGAGALPVAGALVLLLPCALGGTLTCLLLPRAISAHMAVSSTSRGSREIWGVAGLLLVIGLAYGGSLAMSSLGEGDSDVLLRAARTGVEVLAWSPLGALFAAPLDVARGALLIGLARIAIGTLTLVVLWAWWRRALDKALCSALLGDAASATTRVSPLVPRWAPSNAFGASLGKSLRYWRRDSRYLAALGVYPLILLFFGAMAMIGGGEPVMSAAMFLVLSLLSGVSLCNEIGFDGPSGWVNITSGARGRDVLLGKAIASLLLVVPMLVLGGVLLMWLADLSQFIPALVLAQAGFALSSTMTSLVVAVLLPYRASEPGTSPMKDKSATSGAAFLTMLAATGAALVPQLPGIVLGIVGLAVGRDGMVLLAGVLALLVGAVLVLLVPRRAGALLDRRYPDVFVTVRDFL